MEGAQGVGRQAPSGVGDGAADADWSSDADGEEDGLTEASAALAAGHGWMRSECQRRHP